ncbi:MAG: sensor histidine kinase [Gammaproteobacteria bacterium]|nr:sensor histidine kinase [Gammaproteobacteria bacterium]
MDQQSNSPSHMKNDFHIPWWKSLVFRIPVASLLLVMLLISISYAALYQVTRPNLEKTANTLYAESGERLIASIYQQTAIASTLARTIANVMSQLPKNSKQIKEIFPQLLQVDKEFNPYIAGGGMWPEPRLFTPDTERSSFFWGKDKQGNAYFVNDYNNPDGPGYHHEEWYVPVRHLPRDGVYWSRAYTDPYTRQPMITVSAPMYRKEAFYGVVTIDLYLGRLQQLLIESSLIFNGYSFIIDRNNYFVGKPPDKLLSQSPTDSLFDVITIIPGAQDILQAINTYRAKQIQTSLTSNNTLMETARLITQESPGIDTNEAYFIASHLTSAHPENYFENHLINSLSIANNSRDVNLFELPGLNWTLVTVAPTAFKDSSFTAIVKMNFITQLVGIIFVSIIGFILLQGALIQPLDKITRILRTSTNDEQKTIIINQKNELGAIAFWHNRYVLEKSQLNLSLNKKVKARTAELQIAKEEAEQANKGKSRFLANMSHELRTPMHGILGYTDLCLHQDQNKKTREFLGHIKSSAIRLTGLLNDLLDLAKLEAGKTEPSFNKNDLTQLVHQCITEVHTLSNDKKINITVNTDQSVTGLFDKKLMIQVVINLLSNAIKFSPENSCIKINIETVSERLNNKEQIVLKLSVIDQGIGIPENELKTVFDKFVQSSNTKTKAGGTGLGLPIAREILNIHKGRIWAESPVEQDTGTAFHLVIPALMQG